jgi:hypothetical protein
MGSEKSWPFFFPDFLLSSDTTGYSDKKNKQFFRASLDEQTTKTYFSGFWKTGKIIHFEKFGPTFPSRVSTPS